MTEFIQERLLKRLIYIGLFLAFTTTWYQSQWLCAWIEPLVKDYYTDASASLYSFSIYANLIYYGVVVLVLSSAHRRSASILVGASILALYWGVFLMLGVWMDPGAWNFFEGAGYVLFIGGGFWAVWDFLKYGSYYRMIRQVIKKESQNHRISETILNDQFPAINKATDQAIHNLMIASSELDQGEGELHQALMEMAHLKEMQLKAQKRLEKIAKKED